MRAIRLTKNELEERISRQLRTPYAHLRPLPTPHGSIAGPTMGGCHRSRYSRYRHRAGDSSEAPAGVVRMTGACARVGARPRGARRRLGGCSRVLGTLPGALPRRPPGIPAGRFPEFRHRSGMWKTGRIRPVRTRNHLVCNSFGSPPRFPHLSPAHGPGRSQLLGFGEFEPVESVPWDEAPCATEAGAEPDPTEPGADPAGRGPLAACCCSPVRCGWNCPPAGTG